MTFQSLGRLLQPRPPRPRGAPAASRDVERIRAPLPCRSIGAGHAPERREGHPLRSSPLVGWTVAVTGAARGPGRRSPRRPGCEKTPLEEPAVEVDVTDPAAVGADARTVRQGLGRPSAAVAAEGIAEGGPCVDSDPATWDHGIDVDLTGSTHRVRASLPDVLDTAARFLQLASLRPPDRIARSHARPGRAGSAPVYTVAARLVDGPERCRTTVYAPVVLRVSRGALPPARAAPGDRVLDGEERRNRHDEEGEGQGSQRQLHAG
ncbi:SDR family oxidoreductase [Streptomyces canus]|uniref:SDR family oxidoreductase n=1 Tax=Streptomyces canus TaxID=58343 RepID=UPI00216B5D6F|nr:SDR family oxidoreductase [Streptomyces canus]